MVDAALSLERLEPGTLICLETSRGPLSAHFSKEQWELGCAAQSFGARGGASSDSVDPVNVFVLLKRIRGDGGEQVVGFRSVHAEGRILQAQEGKGDPHRFASWKFEDPESWRIVHRPGHNPAGPLYFQNVEHHEKVLKVHVKVLVPLRLEAYRHLQEASAAHATTPGSNTENQLSRALNETKLLKEQLRKTVQACEGHRKEAADLRSAWFAEQELTAELEHQWSNWQAKRRDLLATTPAPEAFSASRGMSKWGVVQAAVAASRAGSAQGGSPTHSGASSSDTAGSRPRPRTLAGAAWNDSNPSWSQDSGVGRLAAQRPKKLGVETFIDSENDHSKAAISTTIRSTTLSNESPQNISLNGSDLWKDGTFTDMGSKRRRAAQSERHMAMHRVQAAAMSPQRSETPSKSASESVVVEKSEMVVAAPRPKFKQDKPLQSSTKHNVAAMCSQQTLTPSSAVPDMVKGNASSGSKECNQCHPVGAKKDSTVLFAKLRGSASHGCEREVSTVQASVAPPPPPPPPPPPSSGNPQVIHHIQPNRTCGKNSTDVHPLSPVAGQTSGAAWNAHESHVSGRGALMEQIKCGQFKLRAVSVPMSTSISSDSERCKQIHQRETRKAHHVAPSPGTVVRKAIAHGMEVRRHSLAGVEETDDEWDE